MTQIPKEVLDAPAEGRLLKCVHEAVLIPEKVWRAYVDPASSVYPLAQRRGDHVWVMLEGGVTELLSFGEVSDRCTCT